MGQVMGSRRQWHIFRGKHADTPRHPLNWSADHLAPAAVLAKQVLGVEDAMKVRAGVAAACSGRCLGALRGAGLERNRAHRIEPDGDHARAQVNHWHYAKREGSTEAEALPY